MRCSFLCCCCSNKPTKNCSDEVAADADGLEVFRGEPESDLPALDNNNKSLEGFEMSIVNRTDHVTAHGRGSDTNEDLGSESGSDNRDNKSGSNVISTTMITFDAKYYFKKLLEGHVDDVLYHINLKRAAMQKSMLTLGEDDLQTDAKELNMSACFREININLRSKTRGCLMFDAAVGRDAICSLTEMGFVKAAVDSWCPDLLEVPSSAQAIPQVRFGQKVSFSIHDSISQLMNENCKKVGVDITLVEGRHCSRRTHAVAVIAIFDEPGLLRTLELGRKELNSSSDRLYRNLPKQNWVDSTVKSLFAEAACSMRTHAQNIYYPAMLELLLSNLSRQLEFHARQVSASLDSAGLRSQVDLKKVSTELTALTKSLGACAGLKFKAKLTELIRSATPSNDCNSLLSKFRSIFASYIPSLEKESQELQRMAERVRKPIPNIHLLPKPGGYPDGCSHPDFKDSQQSYWMGKAIGLFASNLSQQPPLAKTFDEKLFRLAWVADGLQKCSVDLAVLVESFQQTKRFYEPLLAESHRRAREAELLRSCSTANMLIDEAGIKDQLQIGAERLFELSRWTSDLVKKAKDGSIGLNELFESLYKKSSDLDAYA